MIALYLVGKILYYCHLLQVFVKILYKTALSHGKDLNRLSLHKNYHGKIKRFVCLGFIVLNDNFSLISRRQHCQWKAENFELHVCSALMTIEQRWFLSVPRLLWQGASVYNFHFRRLTPTAERLAVKLSIPVLRLSLWR